MLQSLVFFTIAFWLVALGALPFTILSVDVGAWATALGPSIVCSGTLVLYARARGFSRVYPPAVALLFNILLLFPVAVSAYTSMQLPFALSDHALAAFDAALGFDWNATMGMIDSRPWLAGLFNTVYAAFGPQLIVYPLLLALRPDPSRAYKMLICYGVIILASCIVASTAPALGTFGATGNHTTKNINLQHALDFVEPLRTLKTGEPFVFSPVKLAGIISFPSVHAAIAVLCVWALWPIRLLRYPVLVLNVLMAASAVPNGGHYFVDIIAGIAVATWSILAVDRLSVRLGSRSKMRSAGANWSEATTGNS